MTNAASPAPPADQPVLDTTLYGAGPNDNVTDVTENAAITHHAATIGGKTIAYTARAAISSASILRPPSRTPNFSMSASPPTAPIRTRGL